MFFYLSFLRPPPCACVASSASITITPQITNDLRTEFYQPELDIHYIWLSSSGAATSPTKLTRWRVVNAYKALTVSLPKNARPGDLWSLFLWAGDPKPPGATGLDDPTALGRVPLAVLSMPVTISKTKGSTPEKKQEETEREFRIGIGTSAVSIRIRENTSFALDKKMWDSGLGLSSWLVKTLSVEGQGKSTLACRLRDCLLKEDCSILELGTGTGFVSLMLYAVLTRSESRKSRARILATDLPSALPLIEHNIAALKSRQISSECTISGAVLDWDDPTIPPEATRPDVIIMADVTYNTAAFPSLAATLQRLKSPLLVMGYKERDPAERELWGLLGNIQLTHVDDVAGAGGAPVEIRIGVQAGAEEKG